MEEQLELLGDEEQRGGVSIAVVVSLVFHLVAIIWIALTYRPVAASTPPPEMVRYVELIRQQPKEFTEAPGKKVDSAPMSAPYSDANRKASMPTPTGPQRTTRPGDGSQMPFVPPSRPAGAPQQSAPPEQHQAQQQQQPTQAQPSAAQTAAESELKSAQARTFQYHPASMSTGRVDWKSAIQEVGKVASLGGGPDPSDLRGGGGDKGFAENGPLSFESQWYDWGEYAQSMVNRIRVNWYANMPQLIRMGVKGVVVIRFTIHRDGSITDVTILSSSSVPPYDFAAKKSIELSSPLNPLPRDFPNDSERVTCQFYYNQELPKQHQ